MWSGYRQSIPWCGPPPLPPPKLSEQLPLHAMSLDARVLVLVWRRSGCAARLVVNHRSFPAYFASGCFSCFVAQLCCLCLAWALALFVLPHCFSSITRGAHCFISHG